jgi:hypothetical protein
MEEKSDTRASARKIGELGRKKEENAANKRVEVEFWGVSEHERREGEDSCHS